MIVPIAWLRAYVDVDGDAEGVAADFAALGFPVDAIAHRPPVSGVVVGRIARLEKHPNADRLHVCTIDVGAAHALVICTAATNVAAGQIVPVATIGARLPELRIEPRKMRGVDSAGMLCSAAELALPADFFEDGIMQLDPGTELGADVVALFGLGDAVLDVEVTPNRVDAMSVLGLARELAARRGLAVREPEVLAGKRDASEVQVRIDAADCLRFVAREVDGVATRSSPAWMRVRLALAEQRPIDLVVDVTNYVMLELGVPMHAYDAAALAERTLVVRDSTPGETLRTLDGEARPLPAAALVVADARVAQSIAGIRGGAASAIGPGTERVVLEAAAFRGPRVRRASLALGMRTDASSRHEKGIAPAYADIASARAARLLEDAGARTFAPVVAGTPLSPAREIVFPVGRVAALLGLTLADAEIERALRGLGFAAHVADERVYARPPVQRGDVAIAEDVIEEIARVVGYDRIPAVLPAIAQHAISSGEARRERTFAAACAALGYREVVSLSLEPASVRERFLRAGILVADPVEIRNPLSEDQRYLRFSLLPNLLTLAARRGGAEVRRTYEIGRVFIVGPDGEPAESTMLVLLRAGPRGDAPSWRDDALREIVGDARALLRTTTARDVEICTSAFPGLHPGRCAALRIDDRAVATVGAIDPRLLDAYGIDGVVHGAVARLADVPARATPRYVAPSRYPAVERDLALVVAHDVAARAIEVAIRESDGSLVRDAVVFDEYRGKQIDAERKSLAVRITLRRDDATLTDAEADAAIARALDRLRERFAAVVRSDPRRA